MSESFQPIATDQLVAWVFSELDSRDSVFGIPREHYYLPYESAPLCSRIFGQALETPFGPAAGPHSQMAQNIVTAWLCGARYIELKTVQTLDVLDVPKPCIDMEDEGYNVEWSQELKVHQSFDEYLRAWVLIHALHHKLGFPGDSPGIVFNMSVGYDLAGLRQPNMQWFLDQMHDSSAHKQAVVDQVARFHPAVRDLEIPDRLSDNVTLSTMHGCPPAEIESISAYLLEERGLHTLVKCNPTLLGPEHVSSILVDDLGYTDVQVPDQAFEHDLDYADAVPMLRKLQAVAKNAGLDFGVKLSNTLEVENSRTVFDPAEKTMYLSGRALHPITVNLALKLAEDFDGDLLMSFSAGATCFNAPDLLAAGMATVTVCSDLLKTGGYLRLLQYLEVTDEAFGRTGARSIEEFILNAAGADPADVTAAAMLNLRRYAQQARSDRQYIKRSFDTSRTKTSRELAIFDCIRAPCVEACPLEQKIPDYLRAVLDGDDTAALDIIRGDNPIPCVLGRACDHPCEQTCVRNQLDEPLAIRDIKRFVTDRVPRPAVGPPAEPIEMKVAVIGAGPGGIAAAAELAAAGVDVEVFERHAYAGGMVGGAVPEYRLPQHVFDRDFGLLHDLGVEVHYETMAGRDFSLSSLRNDGFGSIVIMVGAQLGRSLHIEGEDCDGVIDALEFLRRSREGRPIAPGERVGVIGAGDTAMDCARVAQRLAGGEVRLIYRRTIDEMPADREEVTQLLEEGIDVLELAKPERLVVEGGRLRALVCRRMTFGGDRDASGRKIPHEVADSDFEIPLDTLIVAIGQHAVLDFFADEAVELNERGYLAVDPVTFETSVAGVYAGGDAAGEGPASIVRAAASGRTIASSILGRTGTPTNPHPSPATDTTALQRRRGRREWRVAAPWTPPGERNDFREVVLTYDESQARKEAARCLDCDRYCSLCVGVCPNLALFTYETQPGDEVVRQPYQVAVLADLCNECGNCTTFCPTAGAPYRDKPRLYLERSDFEAQDDNAFMVFRQGDRWSMDARFRGVTHSLDLDTERPQSEPFATMFVLLRGLQNSRPHLPTARTGSADSAVRVSHPGYRD